MLKKGSYLFVLLTCLIFSQDHGFAQNLTVGDPFEQYIRLFGNDSELDNLPSFNIRPINFEGYFENNSFERLHPWENHYFFQEESHSEEQGFQLFSPQLKTTFNSHLPAGQNDGALWQGRGLNSQFTAGFKASYGILHVSVEPKLLFSQNRDFGLSQFAPADSVSVFGDPRSYTAIIDKPQRYGSDAVTKVHPGESWIRLEYEGVATGISTENIWSGPAYQNPIVFSNNGPGFFHGFLGSYKPVKTAIGNFEWRWLGGRLNESDYFDQNEANNKRFLNAIILSYSPSFIPGLHIGGSRTIQKYYDQDGISFSDFFEVFQPFLKENFETEDNPRGNLGTHQLLSLFARWMFPSFGMEVYTEWSRNDHAGDSQDLLRHIEHARAYVLGLTKKIELSNSKWLTTNIEVTQLEVPRLDEFRHTGSYYHNGEVIQGFTHYGQVLGAGIGPGSNSQIISLNYFQPRGMWGVSLNRIVHHNDRLYQLYDRGFFEREPWELNTVEFRLGLHGLRFLNTQKIEVKADLYLSRILNYDYQYKNDKNNINLQLNLRYYLPGSAR